ncbi:MAG: glycosyltransferase family 39 protein, partial [Traorella sp.]
MEKTVNKKKALYAFIIIMVILGLAIIFSFRSPLNIFQQTESGRDSSVFQYIATLMKKGAMPYRDTFDHKGPLLYLINYLGISISSRYGIWFIEICFLFISFLGIYRIARLFVKQIPSLIILLASSSLLFEFFDGGNYSEEYSIMFIIIALFIFIDYFINRKISNKRLILLGITFACVCMIRINMIATWLVLCLFVLVESIQQKEYKELIRYLLFFMVGIFIVCVPILLWLVANNSFNEFIHDYFIFNLSYSSSETSIIRARIRTAIYFSRNTIVLLMFMLMLFLLKEDKNKRFNIAYLCYMILTFISVIMSGRMYDHYGMTLVPLFAYPVSRSLNLVAERLELKKDKTIVSLVMLIPIICIALPNWLYYTQDTIGLFM